MKLLVIIICTLAIVSTGTHLGVASAAPTVDGPVNYRISAVGHSMRISVSNGSITTSGQSVSLRSRAGAERLRIPLAFRLNGIRYRLTAVANRTSATLTPMIGQVRKPAASNGERLGTPRTRQERDRMALALFNEQVSAAMTVSTILGMALGAVVGGVTGCVLGLPIFGVGCIPGFIGGTSVGSILGGLAGGGGGLIVFGLEYWRTINSPFTPPNGAK
ncbi:glycine zipper family protein [Gordonia sp. CPCC 205333]|uniref:glycine zipper family protein n=1 Tax=Gordonia sp. CPCC 205333 TaxID=3140790 RepID=UPI003AF3E371